MIILKNWHYSLHIPTFWVGNRNFHWNFQISPSMAMSGDNNFTNKIVGIGYGMLPTIKEGRLIPAHHQNSIRIGWESNRGRIQLRYYVYEKGVRYNIPIFYVKVFDEIMFTISENGEVAIMLMEYGNVKNVKKFQFKGEISNFGYDLKMFYGGTPKSPHKIKINIE